MINVPDWIGQVLYGIRHVLNSGTGVNDSSTLNVVSPLAAAYNDATNNIDLTLASIPPLGDATATSLTVGTYSLKSPVYAPTTDGSTVNLVTISLPPSRRTVVRTFYTGDIFTGFSAFSYSLSSTQAYTRIGTGAATTGGPALESEITSCPLPFNSTSGQPGSITGTLAAASLTLQAVGVGAPSAWSATTYVVGMLVTKSGNVYIVSAIAGTGASTSGPAGTGQTVDNAGGNQVVWDRVAAGTSVPIQWAIRKLEVF